MVIPELSPQSMVCAELDSSDGLCCPENSSGPAQHPVLAGLWSLLLPARGCHQSPGMLPAGPLSGLPSHPKVLSAPLGGWGGCGVYPPHHCKADCSAPAPACCSLGLCLSSCSTMKRQRFSLRMLAAWIHPASKPGPSQVQNQTSLVPRVSL